MRPISALIYPKQAKNCLLTFLIWQTVHHHPCDKENWYRFILSVYRRREYKKLHEDNLRILLQETYGWSEEAADELASSYRESLNLIRFIKKGRIA